MVKLKLGRIVDDKLVKVTAELPAAVRLDLIAYAELLARKGGGRAAEPTRLIVPMLERFMATTAGL